MQTRRNEKEGKSDEKENVASMDQSIEETTFALMHTILQSLVQNVDDNILKNQDDSRLSLLFY